MIHQKPLNGGLGQSGSSTDKLRSSYDNYNSYRGEMENSRKKAERTFDEDRASASASMLSNNVSRNSPEWDKTMANVTNQYNTAINDAESTFNAYKTGTDYGSMVDAYGAGTAFDQTNGLSKDIQARSKPTFDEFFDAQYGTPEAKRRADIVSSQRKANVLTIGARQ